LKFEPTLAPLWLVGDYLPFGIVFGLTSGIATFFINYYFVYFVYAGFQDLKIHRDKKIQ
jgi:hypothetical protein